MRHHPDGRHHGTDVMIICLVFALAGLAIACGYGPLTVTTTVAAISFAAAELVRSTRGAPVPRGQRDTEGDPGN